MKRKYRKQRKTVLIYCEGKTEKIFVKYLQTLFAYKVKMKNRRIKIKEGYGGSPLHLIYKVKNDPAIYKDKYIILDKDKKKEGEINNLEDTAKKHDIQLLWSVPCLEGLFLKILRDDFNEHSFSSVKCKSLFKHEYNKEQDQWDKNLLEKCFPKEKLNVKRKTIPILEKMIHIMEGK